MKAGLSILSVAAALSLAAPAEAKVIKFVQGGLTVLGAAAANLELNSADATIISFKLTSKARVSISFSADCVALPVDTGWVEIDIIVDGVKLPPTDGNFDIFCHSSNEVGGMHSITIAKVLAAGQHTLSIEGAVQNGANAAVLGDTSLVISN